MSQMLTILEEENNDGDGPNVAKIKNARCTRSNTNDHATTKREKARKRLPSDPRSHLRRTLTTPGSSLASNSTPPRPHQGKEARQGGPGKDNRVGGEAIVALKANEDRGGAINRIMVNRK